MLWEAGKGGEVGKLKWIGQLHECKSHLNEGLPPKFLTLLEYTNLLLLALSSLFKGFIKEG